MADQWNGGQSGPGERWNVNLPAVIGVVFVFLVGVIVWVIAASGGDEEGGIPGSSVPSVSTTSVPPGLSTASTTPLPMPSTTVLPPPPPATRSTDGSAHRAGGHSRPDAGAHAGANRRSDCGAGDPGARPTPDRRR